MKVKKLLADNFNKYKQFIMFCCVGVINTLVTYIVFIILRQFNVNYLVANTIGDIAGGVNSYIWNKTWVFKLSNTKNKESIPKFIVTFIIYVIASALLMKLCVDIFGINDKLAKLVVLPITTVLNYLMNKVWTFSKK